MDGESGSAFRVLFGVVGATLLNFRGLRQEREIRSFGELRFSKITARYREGEALPFYRKN